MATYTGPGTVIGTVSAGGGDFYTRKAAALSASLANAAARVQARREGRERRELEEIETFYTTAMNDPELGVAMGAQLKQRYGDKYPTLAPMVDVLTNRAEEAAKIQGAANTFANTLHTIETEFEAEQAAVAGMPDVVPGPMFMPPSLLGGGAPPTPITVPMPNRDKLARQAQLSSVNPATFEYMALEAMHPRDRARARLAKVVTVSPFDPMGDDLTPQQKAMFAATAGWLVGDSARVARIDAGLESSPAKIEEYEHAASMQEAREAEALRAREHRTSEREERHTDVLAEENARNINRRSRAAYQDSLIRGRQRDAAAQASSRGSDKGGPLWSFAIEQSDDQIERWQQAENEVASTVGESSRPGVRAKYRAENPRPARLTTGDASAIADMVQERVDAGDLDPARARETVALLVEEFSRLTSTRNPRRRMSSAQALARIEELVSVERSNGTVVPGAPQRGGGGGGGGGLFDDDEE